MKIILGNGLLGREIKLQTNWKMVSRKDFDITRPAFELLDEYDTLINCISFTDTYSKLRDEHWNVNYKGVKGLIDYCNNTNKKLVHISTGYIYAGSVQNAKETDVPVHNQCWYTYTKLLADGLVQLEANNYLLIRCIHKPRPFPYSVAWIDQVGNFDYVDVIAELIIKLINKNATGVYNVGTELKTMRDIAPDSLPTFSRDDIPKNVSMNLNKMKCEL
jgi:dTDP-4-dehydrorhamnose reductase